MYSNMFTAESIQLAIECLKNEIPFAIWETFYVTIIATVLALLIGLPLGVLLVAGAKNGVKPLPSWLMSALNIIINLLRSVPFLILMIMALPLSRAIIGTTVGTKATIIPLFVAAFPYVARLVESSIREIDPNIIEAAQSMGATPFQIIFKVMIPESIPSLINNSTIALTTILGYSCMAGILGGGGLLLCTKYIGEGQKEKVNAIFTYIMITGLVIAEILTLICGFMPETVASLFGANEELIHDAGVYIQSYSYGVIATFMNFMLMNFVRLDGADSLPLVATLLGTVGNIIMDILFCKYLHWGVFGLALATSLTGFISCAVVMTYFLKKDRTLHLAKMYDVINIKDVAEVLKLGSPEALNTFCQVARAIMLNYVLVNIGSTMAMNSYAIQDTVNSIVCAVPVGIAAALNFNVGLYYGEKDGNAVKKTLKAAVKIAVVCSVILLVLIVVFSKAVVSLFGTGTEEAVTAIRFLGIVLLFRSLSEILVRYFQSVHKVAMSLYIGLAHHVLFMFISLQIFPRLFGLTGVWIAMISAEALTVISVIVISLIKSISSGLEAYFRNVSCSWRL